MNLELSILGFLALCALSTLVMLAPTTGGQVRRVAFVMSSLVGLAGFAIALPSLFSAPVVAGFWRIDPLSALIVSLIALIQWTSTLASLPYFAHEEKEGIVTLRKVRAYYALVALFVGCMVATALADNLGVMWVGLEATTLTTTLLVAFYGDRTSLEAAWKYLILCSVGISLGLLGLLFAVAAAQGTGLSDLAAMSFSALLAHAGALSPEFIKLAFVLILVGYGTKVGLVPLHAWLPDAHGRSPAPMSALLSGVLLTVALLSLVRMKGITDAALGGSSFTDAFFLFFGALSFIVPAAFIISQQNYKRLFAYSSIEHMGFIVFCLALGPVGAVAAIVHIVGHALTKSMLFFAAGNILLRFKETSVERVGAVMKALPKTGAFLLFGMLMLLAVPPSPLFFSELLAIAAALSSHPWALTGVLLAGAVIVTGFIRILAPFLYLSKGWAVSGSEPWNASHTAMALHALLIVGVSLALFSPVGASFINSVASYL